MENLYDVLSNKDKELIEKYIEEYIIIKHAPLKDILRFWSCEKINLYNLLNKNLFIHKPITVEKEQGEVEIEVMKKLQSSVYVGEKTFYEHYLNWIYSFPTKKDYHVDLQGIFDKESDYYELKNLVSVDYLMENRYRGPHITMHMPSGHDYSFTNGTKVFKILKKIADEFNIAGFEEYRLKHSQILNEKTIKGELYLSIHPLDFMTMSDNDNGWHSCMSWIQEGDYRRGTIEMMNSPMVIEAFIPSTIEMNVPGGKWNNKRWRQLFIVNKNCIVAIKGYPYWNENIEKIALDWIKELAETNLGWEYQEQLYVYNGDYDSLDYYDSEKTKLISSDYSIEFETEAMYNDLYSTHKAYLSKDFPEETLHINYSGKSVCLACGDEKVWYDNESDLICEDCIPHYYCEECGRLIDEDDEIFKYDGKIYCHYCADLMPTCDDCGEIFPDEDLIEEVYLRDSESGEVYNKYLTLCETCLASGKYFPLDDVKFVIKKEHFYFGGERCVDVKVIDTNNLTSLGQEAFDLESIAKFEFVDWEYTLKI